MYAYPVSLPIFSNREDFVTTISLFDDDTGNAINLSGTNGSGTFSSWQVTDGAIVTTSTTTITIPAFPIGNQLSALSLTVGAGLAINAGDPIQITAMGAGQSGQNYMYGYVTSYNASTGALVVQIGSTFQFEIRRSDREYLYGDNNFGDGYTAFYDVGTTRGAAPLITASLGNGITIVDVGFLQINIPESQMRTLGAKSYRGSMTMTDSVSTRQVMIAEMPVVYGGVTQ